MADLVQRGSITGAATSATVSLGTAIDTSKSFIMVRPILPASQPASFIEAYFDTTGSSISSFTLKHYNTTSMTIYWQVITMDNISVQHFGDQTYASGSTSVSQTISSVTTSKTFCVVSGSVNTTTAGNGYQGFYMADLTTSTNVNVLRGASGTAGAYSLQVVSFTDSTTVQKASFSWTGSATNSQTISTVDLSSAWFVYGFNISSGGLSALPNLALSDTTHITATRVATSGSITTAAIAYVVSMSGVSKEHDSGSNITTDPQAVTISNVTDTSKAFVILSNSSTGTGTSWTNSSSAAEMVSTSEVDLHAANFSQTTAWELQTVQLPGANVPPTTPILNSPSNTGTVTTTTPTLNFTDTDNDGDSLSYEVEIDTVNTFNSQGSGTITRDTANEPSTNPTTSTGNFTTRRTSSSFTPQASTAVFVVVSVSSLSSAPTVTITDSLGNTYAQLAQNSSASTNLIGVYWYYYATAPGSITVGAQSVNSDTSGMFEILNYLGVSPTQTGNTVTVNRSSAGTLQGSLTVGANNIVVGGGTNYSDATALAALANSTIAGHFENSATGDAYSSFTSTTTGTNTYGYSSSKVGGFAAVEVQAASGGPLIDALSSANPGFADSTNPGDTNPFPSGDTITYTVQSGSALVNTTLYYWRVRAIDPSGSNTWGSWSSTYSFTVSLSLAAQANFFYLFSDLL